MGYILVTNAEDLGQVANEISAAAAIGLDIETTALHPFDGEIRLVQINTQKNIWVIDLFQTKTLGPVLTVLAEQRVIVIGQNLKFEQRWFLYKYGLELWPIFDTWRASELIYNGYDKLGHNLYDLYLRELREETEIPDQGLSDWSGPLSDKQLLYAADDVRRLPRLRDALRPKLVEAGLLQTALIEFGAILPEASVENNGIYLHAPSWLALAEDNAKQASLLQQELLYELPNPKDQISLPGFAPSFNLGSPSQMLESFRRLGIPDLADTKEMTLAMYAGEFPVIKKFLQYREYSKRVEAFGPDYLSHVNPKTLCIHTSFFPFTGAGRYASSKPNLQQIPRDPKFRSCFQAEEGLTFVLADYGNIEMRIVAEISGDKTLIKVFVDGRDAHYATAALLTGKEEKDVLKKERQEAKPVNFGFIYGMQAPKLVLYAQANYGVALTLKKAKEFRERFFKSYIGIQAWHDKINKELEACKKSKRPYIARTLDGRLRHLNAEEAYNEAKNCLDEETEALTQRGWVRGFDLKKDDVLLTKNAESGALEWQQMTDLKQWDDYTGPLVEIRSRSFNAVSTPNHRWLVRDKSSGKDIEKTTETLSKYGDHRIHRTGDYNPDVVSALSPDEAELLGWFVTDGSLVLKKGGKRGPKPRPRCSIHQSPTGNPEKHARIEALLARLDVQGEVTVHKQKATHGCSTWNLGPTLSRMLYEFAPGRVLLISTLLVLDRVALERLREAMLLGDGTFGTKTSFTSGTRANAEAFQILCTLTGSAASLVWRDMSKYEPKSPKLKNIPKMTGVWVVTVLNRQTVQVQADQYRAYPSKNRIWCPIVPNTFFVMRREGQVAITGNTPVQGTGAGGLKKALREVYMRLKKYGGTGRWDQPFVVKMRHHVHDEIILTAPDGSSPEATEIREGAKKDLKGGMEGAMQPLLPRVPVEADAAEGKTWASK